MFGWRTLSALVSVRASCVHPRTFLPNLKFIPFSFHWQSVLGTVHYKNDSVCFKTASRETQPCITLLFCFAAHPHTFPPSPLRAFSNIHIAWEHCWKHLWSVLAKHTQIYIECTERMHTWGSRCEVWVQDWGLRALIAPLLLLLLLLLPVVLLIHQMGAPHRKPTQTIFHRARR